jgi:YVTN family beta-propeller protein
MDSVIGSAELTVTDEELLSIKVTPTNPSIAKGTKQQFTATGTFTDSTTQDLTDQVTWSSSYSFVATISNTSGSRGLATGLGVGFTKIKAIDPKSGKNNTAGLNVTGPDLLSIRVTPTNPSIAKGTKQQFTATGAFTDSTKQNLTDQVTWSSSNSNVATISNTSGSKGLATTIIVGSTKILAIDPKSGKNGSAELTVISPTTFPDTVTATIPVGDYPRGIAVKPDGSYVYVINGYSDSMSVIRTSDNTVTDTISIGSSPSGGIAVTPDGSLLYVADFNDVILVISTSNFSILDTITTDYPIGVAVSPDGNYVYTVNAYQDTMSTIRTSDNAIVKTTFVGDWPTSVTVSPDGNRVYVNPGANSVLVINVSNISNYVIEDTIIVGSNPVNMSVTPDGSYCYAVNMYDDTVSVIRTSDNTVIDTISVGDQPMGAAVTPDGNYVYVTNNSVNTVSVIRTSDNTVIYTITDAGGSPNYGIAVTPDGSRVYVTNQWPDTVTVIE